MLPTAPAPPPPPGPAAHGPIPAPGPPSLKGCPPCCCVAHTLVQAPGIARGAACCQLLHQGVAVRLVQGHREAALGHLQHCGVTRSRRIHLDGRSPHLGGWGVRACVWGGWVVGWGHKGAVLSTKMWRMWPSLAGMCSYTSAQVLGAVLFLCQLAGMHRIAPRRSSEASRGGNHIKPAGSNELLSHIHVVPALRHVPPGRRTAQLYPGRAAPPWNQGGAADAAVAQV